MTLLAKPRGKCQNIGLIPTNYAKPLPEVGQWAKFAILFADEGGIGSGVRRDWLNSMMKSMLDPQTGLFESCDGGRTWQPCPLAHMQEQHLVYFEMLGELCSYFQIIFTYCITHSYVAVEIVHLLLPCVEQL